MAIRSACFLSLLLSVASILSSQEAGSFPPSVPYRVQLAARGPIREIGLREALAMALAHNLEIEIDSYGRELSREATISAKSYFDTVATLNTSVISSDIPATNILQTGALDSLINKAVSVMPGIQQNIPGGGAVTVFTNIARNTTNSQFSFINPVFGSTLGFSVTQPLWRGFRRTAVERQIVVSRLNEKLSESQFRQKVAYVIEQVVGLYWRLAVTIDYYESRRQARDVAVLEYEQLRKRVQQGQDTPLALSSQLSDLASHEQTLTLAATQIVQASNNLKRQLTASVIDPLWTVGLLTSDRPDAEEPSVGLDDAVRRALESRPELDQLRIQLRQSDADLRFYKQETKPSVNLRLDVLSTGSAGTAYQLNPDSTVSTTPDPSNPAYGGIGKSYGGALTFDHPSVDAGLEIRLPLRNRAATSQLTTAAVNARKLQAQMNAAQEDILVEVRNAWETIAAQRKNVEAALVSRRLSADRLATETAKNVDDTASLDVLRDQRDLADAQVRELQALVDYQLAKVAYEKAMNSLVDDEQIVLARRK